MKKLYVGLLLGLATACLGIKGVDAAKVSVVGSDKATVGENITLNVRISDLGADSVIGIGGQISYDKDYLELVSMKGMNEPYSVAYNLKNAMFAGFATSEKSLDNDKNVLSVTFKLIKEGNTTVGIAKNNGEYEIELTDANTDIIKDVTIVEKNIIINKKVEVEEVKQEEVVKEETPKKEKVKTEVSTPKNEETTVEKVENVVVPEVKHEEKEEVVVKSTPKKEEKALNSEVEKKETIKSSVKEETLKKEEIKIEVPTYNITNFLDRFKAIFTNKKEDKSNNLFGLIGLKLMALAKRA